MLFIQARGVYCGAFSEKESMETLFCFKAKPTAAVTLWPDT